MKFTLKNIGLIKNSEIKLDGLTVITGRNNSGKTTVGKALYACIEGASDIEEKYENYKNEYLEQSYRKIYDIVSKSTNLIKQYIQEQPNKYSKEINDTLDYIDNLKLVELNTKKTILFYINFLQNKVVTSLSKYKNNKLLHTIKHTINSLNDIIVNEIDKSSNYTVFEFMNDNLNEILRKEFANQIQPVKNKNKSLISELKIYIDDVDIFNIYIANNKIINEKSAYKYIKYNNSFLIDNPFIIDELDRINSNFFNHLGIIKFFIDDDLSNYKYITHNKKLKEALSTDKYSKNIFEKGINRDLYKNINNIINDTIPGTISSKKHELGFEYVHSDYSLNISNLATGTKLFAIMKTLIDKGAIDDNTVLILDEPESHLHPEWQNIFAELLVLLVKDVNCRILLTTHSPNFLLAIEAFMYKHSIVDKCNFYKTQFNNDNETVDYVLTNNTNEIYGDFVKFLSQVKQIRNTYAHYKEDIDNE